MNDICHICYPIIHFHYFHRLMLDCTMHFHRSISGHNYWIFGLWPSSDILVKMTGFLDLSVRYSTISTMDKVQKPGNSEHYTSSSEHLESPVILISGQEKCLHESRRNFSRITRNLILIYARNILLVIKSGRRR
jgi:hypothetical protein